MLVYFVSAAAVWFVWLLVRRFVGRSPLAQMRGPPSSSLVFGNMSDVFAADSWAFHETLSQYGAVSKLTGMFGRPWLHVYDPKALHSIFIGNQDTWETDAWILDSMALMLGPGLLSVRGDAHRKQRKMLLPVFGTKHLKAMTPVFYAVANNLVQAISARVEDGPAPVDVLSWMGRTALEIIGQSGIGHSFDPLTEDVADEYAAAIKEFMSTASAGFVSFTRLLYPAVQWLGTGPLQRKILEAIPSSSLRKLIGIVDTLDARSREIFAEKKAEAKERGGAGEGKDIMSILLRANMDAGEEDKLPEDQLIAQMSTIMFAAMDTTSSALSRALQLLAERPHVQDKLRRELQEASNGGELDYDGLHSLPYLDAICRETLRLYSPVSYAFRTANKDTVLPLSEPLRAKDGALMHEVPVPRGTQAFIGVLSSNRNKAVWGDDADEWKPERWLQPLRPELEKARIPGVYSHLMTFMAGSRSCIGFNLSQLEMKLILSVLVQTFAFERGDRPIVWNLSGIAFPSISKDSSKPEMWLTVRKL